jgi:ABC-type phosphate/phosphonate transport system substrate-binding protein
MAFVTVALDPETRQADTALERYLKDETSINFDPMPMEYEAAIHRLANWPRGGPPYLARMTPYAYVAAEMLGANFDILATYNSKATSVTTYYSYFVVNRKHFARSNPGLRDLLEFLQRKPAKFIYHDRFSTSSYFLPSLYFRSQRIFMTSEPPDVRDQIVRLEVARDPGGSSGALVEQVARGAADLAAVWDGTKQKFQQGPLANQVYFIQLPDPVPNDLLVYSRSTPRSEVDRLRRAIGSMNRRDGGEINTGDYRWWEDFKKADGARSALANLRRIAAQHRAPVTVQIQATGPERESAEMGEHVEAARQAVRLSGSEFVLFDEDSHDHKDVVWTLDLVHDGSVALTSDIIGAEVPPQQFEISFTGISDLTKRIGMLIHSRMHRIRYLWPYEEKSPTIIRDVDFSVSPGTTLKARRITWLNPERNHFREGTSFEARVKHADFYKFMLDDAPFPKVPGAPGWAYEPMSNVAYRIVLVRPTDEPLFIQALTGVLLFLLTGVAVACTVDIRRREARLSR